MSLTQEIQIERLRENKCVDCGSGMDKNIYVVYPTCCRDCAYENWLNDFGRT